MIIDDELVVGQPTIGYKMKRVREILGVKQDDLGNRIGVTQQTISEWEKSEMIKKTLLQKFAKGLDVTPEAIINFEEKAPMQFFNCTNSGNGTFATNGVNNNNNTSPELIELLEKYLKELKDNICKTK